MLKSQQGWRETSRRGAPCGIRGDADRLAMSDTTMDSAYERQLKRLRRALSTSTNELDREQYAFAIAALGTLEAHRVLVGELERQTRAKEACAAALREVGDPATPLLLHAIERDPDNRYLPHGLSLPLDDEAADGLIAACERTTDEWVVLMATQLLAKYASKHLPKLGKVVHRRRSSLFTAAMHCALLGGRAGADVAALERYLTAASPVVEQDLALAFPAVRQLPAAKDLLRGRITQGLVGDRAHALRLIGGDGASDFAGLVLDVWLHDKSPTVHFAAADAIRGLGDSFHPSLQARLTLTCEALAAGIASFFGSLQPGDAVVTGETSVRLAALGETVRQLEEIWFAAFLCGSMSPDRTGELTYAYRSSIPRLIGLAAGLDGQLQMDLFKFGERLIRNQLGLLRHSWINGDATARLPTLEVLGLPIVALCLETPSIPQAPKRQLAWDDFFGELSRCCEEIVTGWWRLNWGFPEGLEVAQYPFASLTYLRLRIANLITGSELAEWDMLPAVLSALQQSRDAEREAREHAEAELGPVVLASIQQEFDEQPLMVLSLEERALADFVRSHEQPRGEIPPHVRVAGPMLAEQIFQTVLLNVAAAYLTPRAVAMLIECTDSNSALVVECAQTLLFRAGRQALTRILMAVPRYRTDQQRAHLLEVCCCIDASSALAPARDYVASDDPLVAASCLRVLEKAGTAADVPTIKLAATSYDELVRVSALLALGRLAPDQSVDEFSRALSHQSATVRYASLSGLQHCSDEVQCATGELLSRSPDAFRRTYGQALSDTEVSLALCPRFRGKPIAVAGSFVLGARLAPSGPAPWQWGLGDLFAQDADFDWDSVWSLIGGDEELTRDWIEYTLLRDLPPQLLTRLAAVALRPEGGAEAEQAERLLLVLARATLEPILRTASHYYALPYDAVLAAAPDAFYRALRASSPRVHGLGMPNPSVKNPLGEGVLFEFVNESLAFGMVFSLLFKQALPEVLSIPRPPELDSSDDAVRLTATEEQWRHLMACQDFAHGLWVEPLLTPDDLVWYCDVAGADPALCHDMINYLVVAITLLPHFHATREKHEQALRRIFRPLLRKTFARLARLHENGADRDGLGQTVDEAFWAAFEAYDAIKYWSVEVHLPLGTLDDLGNKGPVGAARSASAIADRPYVPFPLFLEKRMEELVRTERSALRRTRGEGKAVAGDRLEVYEGPDANERWRVQEAAIIDAIDEATGATGVDYALLGLAQLDLDWLQTKTADLVVDGETVPCVDMETLGAILGKKPEALRQRHHRGRLKCILHEGLLYCPAAGIPEEFAASLSDAKLGELLGIHRNTVGTWRREAPPGLSAVEMARYLRRRVKRE
jgi:HEAT repeat protein